MTRSMGLLDGLKNLFGGGRGRDPALGDPVAGQLLTAIARYDYSSTDGLLPTLRDGRWNDRGFYVDLIAEHSIGFLSGFDTWCASQPGSAIAFLLRGATKIHAAWQARGGGVAATVSAHGANAFEKLLMEAERDLDRVIALDPTDPTPWALMMRVARGRNRGVAGALKLHGEVMRRDPANWKAHAQMVQALAPKWGGEAQTLLTFARTLPMVPGGANALVLVGSHIELWLDRRMRKDAAGAQAYLADPRVTDEVNAAVDATLMAPPSGPWQPLAWNVPAFFYFVVGDLGRLAPLMTRLGRAGTDTPWGYKGDPDVVFPEARRLAGA